MARNSDTIGAFIGAWAARDLEKILSFFAEDATYLNVPMEPLHRGKEEIRKAVEGFVNMASAIEFRIHHQSENAQGTVMNERTDRFKMGEKWIELPVMGIFEFRGDKISAWRDYFDVAMFMKQMPQQQS